MSKNKNGYKTNRLDDKNVRIILVVPNFFGVHAENIMRACRQLGSVEAYSDATALRESEIDGIKNGKIKLLKLSSFKIGG